MRKFCLTVLKKILKVLAKLTLWRYKPTIIGITGNVGKTSTKIAIETVLSHAKKVRVSSKSFNNEIGLPLAVLGAWEETDGVLFWPKVILVSLFRAVVGFSSYPEVLVLEYGVDRPGDMEYLLDIARPHVGVVTAVGEIPVHIEFFAGKEHLVKEKAKLVHQLPATGFSLLNADDVTVYEMREQTRAHVVTYGFSENADMRVSGFEASFERGMAVLLFKLHYGGSFIPARLEGVLGRSQGYIAAAAAAVGLISGMNLVTIAEALDDYHSPPGRLKVLQGMKGSIILDDTYNASPLAVEEALTALKGLKVERKIAVLGDMLEIGKYTLEAHESIGKLVSKTADMLVTVGMRGKFIAEGARKAGMSRNSIVTFDSIKEAGIFLQGKLKKGDVVLVKGSQAVRMEKIVKEIMADPGKAERLLVRQNKRWLKKKGTYE